MTPAFRRVSSARRRTVQEQPFRDSTDERMTGFVVGLDRQLVQSGYSKVDYCSVGKSFCVLQYTKGKACLRLHTQGEQIRSMKVERWSNECREPRTRDGPNLLPADVRYIVQWRNDCENFGQCQGVDDFLLNPGLSYGTTFVLDVETILQSFERFFNSPALMVQISKTACGESRHVEQALLQINRLKHAPDKMIHWPVCIETRQHCSTIGSA